jgi:hypothetical protein
VFGAETEKGFWLCRYVMSASMHADFRMISYESALHSRDYEHTASIVRGAGCVQDVALRQRLQQRLGFLEVSGVKALGEVIVDWYQEVMGFLAFPLLLPETSEAGGSTEFK